VGTDVPEDLLAVQLDVVHGGITSTPMGSLMVRTATAYAP
jgi:hypothetical protein